MDIKGNNILSDNSPIVLEWNNKEGIIFEKKIELDDKYLFKISQQVKNNTNINRFISLCSNDKKQSSRRYSKFLYFSMRDLLVYLMMNLKRMITMMIEEKKIVRESNEGWLG